MHTHKTRALLFDLGGVLIDIDFNRAFKHWQPISRLSFDELRHAFKFDVAYQQHERGAITASEYFTHLCTALELQDDHARIAEGWNSIFVREIVETRSMVQAARAKFPCYVFTNTNITHQAAWSAMFPMLVQSFDRVFASHEMGCRKPERQAFEYVAHALGLSLGSIMFFDDLLENVEGAASAGLQAIHVRGPGDVRSALQTVGVAL